MMDAPPALRALGLHNQDRLLDVQEAREFHVLLTGRRLLWYCALVIVDKSRFQARKYPLLIKNGSHPRQAGVVCAAAPPPPAGDEGMRVSGG
jgi:hypothetical protein